MERKKNTIPTVAMCPSRQRGVHRLERDKPEEASAWIVIYPSLDNYSAFSVLEVAFDHIFGTGTKAFGLCYWMSVRQGHKHTFQSQEGSYQLSVQFECLRRKQGSLHVTLFNWQFWQMVSIQTTLFVSFIAIQNKKHDFKEYVTVENHCIFDTLHYS